MLSSQNLTQNIEKDRKQHQTETSLTHQSDVSQYFPAPVPGFMQQTSRNHEKKCVARVPSSATQKNKTARALVYCPLQSKASPNIRGKWKKGKLFAYGPAQGLVAAYQNPARADPPLLHLFTHPHHPASPEALARYFIKSHPPPPTTPTEYY